MPIPKSVRAALIVGALALAPAIGHAQGQAYTLDDVLRLLKRKVPSSRVLTLTKQDCITFSIDSDTEARLVRAGATHALVDGLRNVCGPDHPKETAAVDSAVKVVPGAVVVAPAPPPPPPPPPPVDTMVPVSIRAAVVEPDLSVRALPLMDLYIIGPNGDTTRASTDTEGKLARSFKAGVYRVESVSYQDVGTSRYRWGFFTTFAKDMQPLELTQKNAIIEALPPPAPTTASTAGSSTAPTVAVKDSAAAKPDVAPPKKVRTEKEIFEDDRSGLFTVFGSHRGSGFLVDSAGLVVTNAHLLENADEVRVQLDTVTKVYARRLVVDNTKDIAVLAINPKRCGRCAVLPLFDTAKTTAPSAGDRVLAFGSPLNKQGVLSLGIVSNADASSVVSDVSVSWLNTGGPLVNLDGYVIGLNTNRSSQNAANAPRVATSVSAADLLAAVEKARDSLPALKMKPVSDSLLPVPPRDAFPPEPIAAVSKLGQLLALQNYRAEVGPFRIFMMTPQVMAWRQEEANKALVQKKRDDPKKAATWTQIDPIEGWRDWSEYLQDRKAVVIFNVMPEKAAFPFYEADKLQGFDDGNFRDLKIYRDGVELVPVEKVRVPAVLNVEQMKAAGKMVAMQGIYVYRIEDFAPRAVGTVANYTVTVIDAAQPTRPYKLTLLPMMIEQMGKDFTPYRFARH